MTLRDSISINLKNKKQKAIISLIPYALTLFNLAIPVTYAGYQGSTITRQYNKQVVVDGEKITSKDVKELQTKIEEEIEKYKQLQKQFDLLNKENQQLIEDNIAYQNIIRTTSIKGTKPKNYKLAPPVNSKSGMLKGKYAGKFLFTAYTPSKEECGSNDGITASGLPIVPGVSVAVDPRYWPPGTVFYTEGIGYGKAMDTGSAIKGRNRMDFGVFNKKFANSIGKKNRDVYLIKKGNGKIEDLDF